MFFLGGMAGRLKSDDFNGHKKGQNFVRNGAPVRAPIGARAMEGSFDFCRLWICSGSPLAGVEAVDGGLSGIMPCFAGGV